ncbi:MAG: chloride channel protein [Clostridia bacterium]|nr:chloride channel protein [Clostridia bacterium]
MKKRFRNYFVNLLIPSFVFGSITGVATAVVISIYKLAAGEVIELSGELYSKLRTAPVWLFAVIPALLILAWLFAFIYRKVPNLGGGGIPTSIGVLRGILPMSSWKNLVGIFTMSLASFFVGVPLGNEGPSVQMGTAVGKGCVRTLARKKYWAWERYSMTGGACAGFSVATGAPISGILFAVEEAHQRISPMIITVSATSVMFAELTASLLARFLPISTSLFPSLSLLTLAPRDIWLPIVIGAIIGIFAVLFLRYYRIIRRLVGFVKERAGRFGDVAAIFAVFLITVALGLASESFISTGHHLILSLFEDNPAIWFILLVLLVRASLTLFANTSGVTGGLFVPILALGALIASAVSGLFVDVFGIGEEYATVILVLGITACISAMLKMPLTSIVFAIEALSSFENAVYIIVVAVVSYVITEFFGAQSISDVVVENRAEALHRGKTAHIAEAFVTVAPGSFAVGKQIRDIFWPNNLFVLSVKFSTCDRVEVDGHGGKSIRAGDVLHVRYSTLDPDATKEELLAIVGEQEITEIEVANA